MKTKQIMILVVAALFTMTLAGEAMARGGNGAGNATSGGARPTGSQRRDGTFLSTGTTANGSTARPANGNGSGPRDGSCRTTAPTPAATN